MRGDFEVDKSNYPYSVQASTGGWIVIDMRTREVVYNPVGNNKLERCLGFAEGVNEAHWVRVGEPPAARACPVVAGAFHQRQPAPAPRVPTAPEPVTVVIPPNGDVDQLNPHTITGRPLAGVAAKTAGEPEGTTQGGFHGIL